MSRRRYISTTISTDGRVNRLALEAGDFAVLLYTWLIPHAKDDGMIQATVEELLLTVVPGRRDKTEADAIDALEAMQRLGLVEWDRANNTVRFPIDGFYKHQTYIKPENRRNGAPDDGQRKTPQIAANRNSSVDSAQKAASVSPSPSPSPSLSPSVDDVANRSNQKSSTSSSSSDNPMFVGAHVHDDDPDGQTFRQISATIKVLGSHLQERALMALLDVARKRGFSNEALIFEAEQWASKLGDKRETPGAKVSSYREWMDTAFGRGPPGNGKSLQDRVHKSTAEDRKILNDRYQKQFGRAAYPEDA